MTVYVENSLRVVDNSMLGTARSTKPFALGIDSTFKSTNSKLRMHTSCPTASASFAIDPRNIVQKLLAIEVSAYKISPDLHETLTFIAVQVIGRFLVDCAIFCSIVYNYDWGFPHNCALEKGRSGFEDGERKLVFQEVVLAIRNQEKYYTGGGEGTRQWVLDDIGRLSLKKRVLERIWGKGWLRFMQQS